MQDEFLRHYNSLTGRPLRQVWLLTRVALDAVRHGIGVRLDGRRSSNGSSPWRLGLSDARYAVRALTRSPWYSLTVSGVVALGLSLAATVFAIVDGVLFKPLPYPDGHQLVAIDPGFSTPPRSAGNVGPDLIDQWQAGVPDVKLSALVVATESGLERPNEPPLGLARMRPDLFDVLGIHPLLGGFTAEDIEMARQTRPAVMPVVISYDLWQRRFEGDPGIVGRTVEAADPFAPSFRIAGVMPRHFVLPAAQPAQVLFPNRYTAAVGRGMILARLPDGTTPATVRPRLERAMAEAVVRDYRGSGVPPKPDIATLHPLRERLGQSYARGFVALFAAAATLVLIACLNVSSLMTARCLDRARDIGIRRSIGARSGDIIRVLAAEHAVLFFVGAGAGIALAFALLRLVPVLVPPDVHLLKAPTLDWRVLVFTTAVMLVSLVLASIWPVVRALRADVQTLALGAGSGAVTPRTRMFGARLVTIGQVAGTVVLVIAGGLLVGSLLRVQSNEVGYDVDDVVLASLAIGPRIGTAAVPQDELQTRLGEFLESVRRLPQVTAAGSADLTGILQGGLLFRSFFQPVAPGDAPRSPDVEPLRNLSDGIGIPSTAGFFEAAGIRLLEGRLPSDSELMAGVPVVAVSRSYVRANMPDGRAVGRRLRPLSAMTAPDVEVVGVVEDPLLMGWDKPSNAVVFSSYLTFGNNPEPVVFIRVAGDTQPVIESVLEIAGRDRSVLRPVSVRTASTLLSETVRERRLQSWVFGSFAAAGLLIAGVGLLGLVGMTMARRTREVGIRLALGATRDRLVSGLVREQLMPVAFGLLLGCVAAAWTVRLLEAYLYELSMYDAMVWTVAVLVVFTTTLLGALIPSLTASRVNPVTALRVE
jgi:putative ABC transport system permease protein